MIPNSIGAWRRGAALVPASAQSGPGARTALRTGSSCLRIIGADRLVMRLFRWATWHAVAGGVYFGWKRDVAVRLLYVSVYQPGSNIIKTCNLNPEEIIDMVANRGGEASGEGGTPIVVLVEV